MQVDDERALEGMKTGKRNLMRQQSLRALRSGLAEMEAGPNDHMRVFQHCSN